MKRTKIVATLGPASSSKEVLKGMIQAGANIFRLNFSHGAHEEHEKVVQTIKELNEELNTHVGILADLQGPKIRIGEVENNGVELNPGDIITITSEHVIGSKEKLYLN